MIDNELFTERESTLLQNDCENKITEDERDIDRRICREEDISVIVLSNHINLEDKI